MAEVTKADASAEARGFYNKGFSAFERGNLDFAIELLSRCLEVEPAFLQARKFLRAAEIARFKKAKQGALAHRIRSAKHMPALGAATLMLNAGKIDKALLAFDRLLQDDPLNPKYALPFAKAASAAGIPEAGAQILEIIREHHPSDTALLKSLGVIYTEIGQSRAARECFERLCELNPKDHEAIRLLKDASARESISGDGGWEQTSEKEGGTFRDMIRDGDEAVRLEKESKAVKSDDDAEMLIADLLKKIEEEPANVNYYRALARLYAQRKRFEDSIAILTKAREMNPSDPELDNTLSQTRLQQLDAEIEALAGAGDAEALAAKQNERAEFEFRDVQEKVERYPNDLALRFRWGRLLYENEHFNEAIQQFQLSQRSPKDRLPTLYYMGMCFRIKGQLDMARDQLETANKDMPSMDSTKKDVCYALGGIYEDLGDKAKAAEYYKQIYQADIAYKDIAQKIESLYK